MSSSDQQNAGNRRSGRKRVSTTVKIDGYDVLVKNNYVVKGMTYQTDAYTADVAKKKPKTEPMKPPKAPTERKQSPSEAARLKHNEAVKASTQGKQSYRRDFLVKHREILDPFMDDHTRRVLQQWTEAKSSSKFREEKLFAQPELITGGEMRDYQLVGLNFLVNLYRQNIGMILGDEMGLVSYRFTSQTAHWLPLANTVAFNYREKHCRQFRSCVI